MTDRAPIIVSVKMEHGDPFVFQGDRADLSRVREASGNARVRAVIDRVLTGHKGIE